MQYAKKIELTKNSDDKRYADSHYLKDSFTLKINDILICNGIDSIFPMSTFDSFETYLCDYCGEEGCNGAPMLMLRKFSGGLLFLPEFDCLDSFQQYDYETCEGERGCPPKELYEDGILFVEAKMMGEFIRVVPMLRLKNIPEISIQEIDLIVDWELCVIKKPEGFIAKSYR